MALGFLVTVCSCGPDTDLHDASAPRVRRATDAALSEGDAASDGNLNLAALGPAQLGPLVIEPVADCVRARVSATRPVSAELHLEVGGTSSHHPLGTGASLFDAAFRVATAASTGIAFVTAVDAEGAALSSAPVEFVPPPPARGFVITELLPHPAGDETKQESVEIANFAAQPLSTEGMRLEDAAGFDPLPIAEIPAGARFLVVSASFDAQSASDVSPRAGTIILRVAGRIGRDGLGQKGEILRLRGADQRIESSYGGWIDTTRPVWSGRSVQRRPDDACDHPSTWSREPQAPTPGW
ncbi:MAG TPA: hypothetical protein VGG33_08530 [Polyangia bacterium]